MTATAPPPNVTSCQNQSGIAEEGAGVGSEFSALIVVSFFAVKDEQCIPTGAEMPAPDTTRHSNRSLCAGEVISARLFLVFARALLSPLEVDFGSWRCKCLSGRNRGWRASARV